MSLRQITGRAMSFCGHDLPHQQPADATGVIGTPVGGGSPPHSCTKSAGLFQARRRTSYGHSVAHAFGARIRNRSLHAKGVKVSRLRREAHAFGVKRSGVSAANFGDAAMFSFHATKVFNTIEGGAVCFRDDSLVTVMNDLKNFGIHGPESVPDVGGNAKMNEFCAAMGICNLRHLDSEIEKRKAAYELYMERLSGREGIQLNKVREGIRSNYAYFPVVFDGYKHDRNEVYDLLAEENIIARKYFYPLTNSFECYRGKEGFDPERTPIAKHTADHVLCLPIFADITAETVNRICDIILR